MEWHEYSMKKKQSDLTPKTRVLILFKLLSDRPFGYTAVQLANLKEVSVDTIKRDFEDIKNAGFDIQVDARHRYALVDSKSYDHIKELLYFTETDQKATLLALQNAAMSSLQKTRVLHKLANIYDVTRLGPHLFSHQFLSKINILEQALSERKVIELIDYRSTNSNKVTNRRIEAFHIMPKEDILHGFDIDQRQLRHYRISRIERIDVLDIPWQYASHHNILLTDPFRISNSKQRRVRIHIKVGGFNELIERFPLTRAYLHPLVHMDEGYELDCMVNDQYFGLTNFILGYHEHIIKILEPEDLILHLNNHIEKLKLQLLE